jgi:hypothetical protein
MEVHAIQSKQASMSSGCIVGNIPQFDKGRVACDTGAIRKLQSTTFRELFLAVSEREPVSGTTQPGPRRRDGGRSAQDATATPVITIG